MDDIVGVMAFGTPVTTTELTCGCCIYQIAEGAWLVSWVDCDTHRRSTVDQVLDKAKKEGLLDV